MVLVVLLLDEQNVAIRCREKSNQSTSGSGSDKSRRVRYSIVFLSSTPMVFIVLVLIAIEVGKRVQLGGHSYHTVRTVR